MPDKCLDCPVPSADMDGLIVSGPGGAPRSEGSGVSSPEGPFVREAPRTGHVIIMGTLGADGNPGSLPDAPQVGWAYVAGDAGEYGGVSATEGDVVYCMSLNPVKWGVLQADSDDSGLDLVSVSASFGCDPSPALLLTSVKASGASSDQIVDMSCLVPPVFNGSADGLVPASGAAQNLLLHGDASWSTLVPDPASESGNEAAPVHYVADMLRREVEAYTMGRNTIVRDQWNNPHVMLVVPRFLLSDIDDSWPAVPHPAFIVDGQVRSEFLIGKYEASQSSAGHVLTLPGKAPWTSVDFDDALAACRALGSGFCLQTRAMWAARQLWVHKLNGDGHVYLGNTNYGRSHAQHWQTGVMQTTAFNPGDTGNTDSASVLTGSGGPLWNDDGMESGLADVTGNVSEWVAGMRVLDGEIQIIQDGDACLQSCDMSASSSAWKAVLSDGSLAVPGTSGTMKFDGSVPDTLTQWDNAGAARLNTALVNQNVNGYYSNSFASLSAADGVGVPALLVQLGLMPFSSGVQGMFWVCNKGERLVRAGGSWVNGANSGPWYLYLSSYRTNLYYDLGFRSAFVS